MMHMHDVEQCVVYSRIWEHEGVNNLLFYINAFDLYKMIEESNVYRLDIDPLIAVTQFFPMELFCREKTFGGYSVETLGDHATESTDWIDKVYDFEENLDDLVTNLKSTLNVMNLFFILNLEFKDNYAKNHFKLKHGRFLKKYA